MKQFISIIVIVFLILLGRKGYGLLKKYRYAKQLKFFVKNIQLPKLNLTDIIQPVTVTIHQAITNFSPATFQISALNIDVYSPQGELIAEQTNPLPKTILVKANQTTDIPLKFQISPQKLLQLIRQSGGVIKLSTNYLTTGTYGIPLLLKGYVRAEGWDIDIHQNITL